MVEVLKQNSIEVTKNASGKHTFSVKLYFEDAGQGDDIIRAEKYLVDRLKATFPDEV